ncbi:MAG TPA: hypothetical protein VH092_33010 [Urbifossiella sp.]|nr:hypothetical protein [Urbifossiella sp.]
MSTAPAPTGGGPDWGRLERLSLTAAAGGAVAFAVLAFTPLAGPHSLTQAAVSYSVAFHFWLAVPLGCLVVLMIQYLTGGAWGVLLRPVLEASSRTLGLLALLFVPVAAALFLGAASPYPWARPLDQVARGDVLDELRAKTWLLNPAFVLARAVGYFAVWIALGYFLRAWSARWRAGDAAAGERLPTLSGPGLVAYAVTVTFAAIDWVMSLEPFWISTMYPPLYAVGQITAGFAFATAAAVLLSRYPPLAGRVTPKLLRDLGGLLLTWVMFWAYLAFSQFLLIWAGNLPDETPYYLKRMRGGWEWVGLALVALHFAVPFLVLLFRDVKENGSALLWVAFGVLAMRFVDALWWVEPAFPHDGPGFFWLLDAAALVAVGGVWVWWFVGRLRRVSLEPVHGPSECEPEAGRD